MSGPFNAEVEALWTQLSLKAGSGKVAQIRAYIATSPLLVLKLNNAALGISSGGQPVAALIRFVYDPSSGMEFIPEPTIGITRNYGARCNNPLIAFPL